MGVGHGGSDLNMGFSLSDHIPPGLTSHSLSAATAVAELPLIGDRSERDIEIEIN